MTPLVSVIITTRGRPNLVVRAVSSALAQTLRSTEVIVVLDGPDHATLDALSHITDARVRIHVRETRGGQPAAINSGVQLAQGQWTAMLDDDDQWMPEKLETQLRTARSSAFSNPVVACRFLARSEYGDFVWPLRVPRPSEPLCEYLFSRSRLAFGEGILPTSVLFALTELFRLYPMAEELFQHCDLDWLLRVARHPGAGLEMPSQPVAQAVWQMQGGRDRLSNIHDWRSSYEWITRSRQIVTARAYAGFLLTWVSLSARAQRDFSAFSFLLREAFRRGSPGLMDLVIYAAMWSLPMDFRARLSRAFSARPQVT